MFSFEAEALAALQAERAIPASELALMAITHPSAAV
jgi:hypothetical protein